MIISLILFICNLTLIILDVYLLHKINYSFKQEMILTMEEYRDYADREKRDLKEFIKNLQNKENIVEIVGEKLDVKKVKNNNNIGLTKNKNPSGMFN
jgi:hypothetical protein